MGKLIDAAGRVAWLGGTIGLFWAVAGGAVAAPPEPEGAPDEARGELQGDSSSDLPALGASRLPTLRLLWYDPQHALPQGATDIVRDEVRTIFRGLGVEVGFTTATAETTYGEGPTPEIPVILLREDPIPARRATRVMGLVVRDQKPTRAVWAFLEHVRWTLGTPRLGPSVPVAGVEVRGLGLALGRVVAHEVIHAVVPDVPHARNGLMSHSLDRAFLLGRRADLDGRCGHAFVSQLSALATAVSADAPAASLASIR